MRSEPRRASEFTVSLRSGSLERSLNPREAPKACIDEELEGPPASLLRIERLHSCGRIDAGFLPPEPVAKLTKGVFYKNHKRVCCEAGYDETAED